MKIRYFNDKLCRLIEETTSGRLFINLVDLVGKSALYVYENEEEDVSDFVDTLLTSDSVGIPLLSEIVRLNVKVKKINFHFVDRDIDVVMNIPNEHDEIKKGSILFPPKDSNFVVTLYWDNESAIEVFFAKRKF